MSNDKSITLLNKKECDQPLVTIVIPAYNHERYVAQALLSALNQTYPNIEIIVIDDGSIDDTPQIIERTLQETTHNCNVTFLRQPNQGLSKTLNKAVGIAKGEFIQFLASDDVYLPEKTSICVKALMAAGESVAAVYSDGYLINNSGKISGSFSGKYIRPISNNIYKELLIRNWIPAMGLLYKRSSLETVGGFDESLKVEDYDLLLRLSKIYQIISTKDQLFMYRLHASNSINSVQMISEEMDITALKHREINDFSKFMNSLKSRSVTNILNNCSFLNLELLIRYIIRRAQWSSGLQDISYFMLVFQIIFSKFKKLISS